MASTSASTPIEKAPAIAPPPAAPTRRLGRGLSSLLGTPVKVEVPAAAPSASSISAAPSVPAKSAQPDAQSFPSHRVQGAKAEPSRTSPTEQPRAATSHPADDADTTGARIVLIPVDQVVPNRHQPRRSFDEAGLNELAASIRAAGVVRLELHTGLVAVTWQATR